MNHIQEAIKEKEAQIAKLTREVEALNGYLLKHEPTEKPVKKVRRKRTPKVNGLEAQPNIPAPEEYKFA